MTTNEQQDRPGGEPGQPALTPDLSSSGQARRRFTRAGLGASGVLMTLASQPGMATAVCTTPSGSMSNGLQSSHKPDVIPVCGGNSPGFYANNPSGWPSSPAATSTRTFKDIFPVNASQTTLGNLVLIDVFTANAAKKGKGATSDDIDPHNVAGHVLASYLNILTGRTTVLTEAALRNIWREYQTTGGGKLGYYAPTAGVKWYGDQIVAYLKTTFHQ